MIQIKCFRFFVGGGYSDLGSLSNLGGNSDFALNVSNFAKLQKIVWHLRSTCLTMYY